MIKRVGGVLEADSRVVFLWLWFSYFNLLSGLDFSISSLITTPPSCQQCDVWFPVSCEFSLSDCFAWNHHNEFFSASLVHFLFFSLFLFSFHFPSVVDFLLNCDSAAAKLRPVVAEGGASSHSRLQRCMRRARSLQQRMQLLQQQQQDSEAGREKPPQQQEEQQLQEQHRYRCSLISQSERTSRWRPVTFCVLNLVIPDVWTEPVEVGGVNPQLSSKLLTSYLLMGWCKNLTRASTRAKINWE